MARGRGPLADSYPAAVALVVCALVPFLMLSAALFPLAPLISESLGLGKPVLDVTIGLSDAVYALLAGVAMIVALVIHQYRSIRPLMPVRQLATSFPVAGILAAMCASAAALGLMELILTALLGRSSPGHSALLFLPEFGAAVLTAVLSARGRRSPERRRHRRALRASSTKTVSGSSPERACPLNASRFSHYIRRETIASANRASLGEPGARPRAGKQVPPPVRINRIPDGPRCYASATCLCRVRFRASPGRYVGVLCREPARVPASPAPAPQAAPPATTPSWWRR